MTKIQWTPSGSAAALQLASFPQAADLLPLLDALPEALPEALHGLYCMAAARFAIGRVWVYLPNETHTQLILEFEHRPMGGSEDATLPLMIDFSPDRLRGIRVFRPDSSAVIPEPLSDAGTGVYAGRQLGLVTALEGEPAGLFVIESSSGARAWEVAEQDALRLVGEAAIRSLGHARLMRRLESDSHLVETLMGLLPDAIYVKDLKSRFVAASKGIVDRNGFSDMAELRGKTDFDLFTEEHAEQAFRDEQEVLRTGIPIMAKEEKETWPDGQITWVMTTKMPFRDARGEVVGTFGISRDITQLRETQIELTKSREMLRQRYQAMENDMAQARLIQMALLPPGPPDYAPLRIRFRYEPLDQVGGDFFSFRRLSDGGLAVFLGDLTGHGVSAALFMSLVRCMTDRVFETDGLEPDRYIEALDKSLFNQIPNGFITAVYGVLRPLEGGSFLLTWCGAGHPDPVVVRKGAIKAETLPGGDGALGLFENFPREQRELVLNPGDRLYLYTDGIPETRTAEGVALGFDNVAQCLVDAHDEDLDRTLDQLLMRVRGFRMGGPAEDDVAIIGMEIG